MLTPTLALLLTLSGPAPGHAGIVHVRADSAHTLFVPNAPDPGRAGQVYGLPGGGFGVTTGGTAHYQTLGTPNGTGIAVPSGNNTFSVIGPNGRTGISSLPD